MKACRHSKFRHSCDLSWGIKSYPSPEMSLGTLGREFLSPEYPECHVKEDCWLQVGKVQWPCRFLTTWRGMATRKGSSKMSGITDGMFLCIIEE